jgi:hypothetical protein
VIKEEHVRAPHPSANLATGQCHNIPNLFFFAPPRPVRRLLVVFGDSEVAWFTTAIRRAGFVQAEWSSCRDFSCFASLLGRGRRPSALASLFLGRVRGRRLSSVADCSAVSFGADLALQWPLTS